MKNKLGVNEYLVEFHSNGNISYEYYLAKDGFSCEYTYDENGNRLTSKDSDGYNVERTYDENGNDLTFKDLYGYSWERTYDENKLTYKDSKGCSIKY